jgi:YHS domain-containing protein
VAAAVHAFVFPILFVRRHPMWRGYVLCISLVAVGVVLAAGGCGASGTTGASPSSETKNRTQPESGQTNSEAAPAAEAPPPEGLKELSAEDRAAAEKQRVCPVSGELLGSMGKPVKIVVQGRTVFLCCSGCEAAFRKDPEKYFEKMKKK